MEFKISLSTGVLFINRYELWPDRPGKGIFPSIIQQDISFLTEQ